MRGAANRRMYHPIEYGRTVTNFPPMSPSTRIYIAGHQGLVGSALWRHFTARGFENLIGLGSSELDLRDAGATAAFFRATRPQVVIDAAARVGGIAANALRPADFVSDNLRIQLNLLDTAVASGGVERFLFLGSSCIYPKFAAQPIREEALLTGPLEESNEGYAVAKLAGIAQVTAIRRQHGLPYVSAMPTNLYGPGDNFSPHDSHVVPAMIRRFHEAMLADIPHVTCWGTGLPRATSCMSTTPQRRAISCWITTTAMALSMWGRVPISRSRRSHTSSPRPSVTTGRFGGIHPGRTGRHANCSTSGTSPVSGGPRRHLLQKESKQPTTGFSHTRTRTVADPIPVNSARCSNPEVQACRSNAGPPASSAEMSASTMSFTSSGGVCTLGCQPRWDLAFAASPTSASTSAGRT